MNGSSHARSRFSREPQRKRLVIGERDIEMLTDLYHHRAMSRRQVQDLYFTSVARCNFRLRQLYDHGFLSRHYPPVAPYGAEAIYSVGAAGVRVLAAETGAEPADIRRQCRPSTYLEHTLRVVDFYLAARRATHDNEQVKIELWLPEIPCRHEYRIRQKGDTGWSTEVFKPDGFLRLQGRERHDFFLEMDLGHTSSRQFVWKLDSYARYVESGMFAQRFGSETFTTLVVTTGERRLANLSKLIGKFAVSDFALTTLNAMNAQVTEGSDSSLSGFLGPIWFSPSETGPQSLI